jgi:hypothetical protein
MVSMFGHARPAIIRTHRLLPSSRPSLCQGEGTDWCLYYSIRHPKYTSPYKGYDKPENLIHKDHHPTHSLEVADFSTWICVANRVIGLVDVWILRGRVAQHPRERILAGEPPLRGRVVARPQVLQAAAVRPLVGVAVTAAALAAPAERCTEGVEGLGKRYGAALVSHLAHAAQRIRQK